VMTEAKELAINRSTGAKHWSSSSLETEESCNKMIALNGKNCSRLLPPYNINLICSPSISPKFLLFGEISAPFHSIYSLSFLGTVPWLIERVTASWLLYYLGFSSGHMLALFAWYATRDQSLVSSKTSLFGAWIFHESRNNLAHWYAACCAIIQELCGWVSLTVKIPVHLQLSSF
jgi:hypothetical protein